MSAREGQPPLPRAVELLERSVNYALGCADGIRDGELARPTPCLRWDLRALLAHLSDSLAALAESMELGRVGLDRHHGCDPDPAATFRHRARRLIGDCAATLAREPVEVGSGSTALPLAASVVMGAGAVEVAVHGWDIATARGMHRPIPPVLAEELGPLAERVVTPDDRPERFALPTAVAVDADAPTRLLAFLGRVPG